MQQYNIFYIILEIFVLNYINLADAENTNVCMILKLNKYSCFIVYSFASRVLKTTLTTFRRKNSVCKRDTQISHIPYRPRGSPLNLNISFFLEYALLQHTCHVYYVCCHCGIKFINCLQYIIV